MGCVSMIVAMDRNRVIGNKGDTPWAGKLRRDMDHFKQTTSKRVVLVGRKTCDFIPAKFRPLPDRENVILTRNPEYFQLGCNVIHTVEEVFRWYSGTEIFVIGGAEIYKLFLPYTDKIVVTHIDATFEGDTFFPEMEGNWKPRHLFDQRTDEKNHFPFCVTEYFRI